MRRSRRRIGVQSSPCRELDEKFLLSIVKLVSLIKHAPEIRRLRQDPSANPSALSSFKESSYLQRRSRARAHTHTHKCILPSIVARDFSFGEGINSRVPSRLASRKRARARRTTASRFRAEQKAGNELTRRRYANVNFLSGSLRA
jgi:hypothetical protein